ncbi:uncharacterized protein LOC131147247 [Malania oleifera]|uniref:uncharacterized protein LOC131147247 n=1 Tax=Malania oleifera TaxID=397392 RepID=UPI0025AE0E51|nr:uncharacterized protein LOC131147247 [Malania oleifera]
MHNDYQEVVKEGWEFRIKGCNQFRFVKKLHSLKKPLRNLNIVHFSYISTRADKANAELMDLQQLLHDNPFDTDIQKRMVEKNNEASKLREVNKMFLDQLAKGKYLKECDKSMSFFHTLMRRHTSRNHISAIMKNKGEQTNSQTQVAEEFLRFYKELLGKEVYNIMVDDRIITKGRILNDSQRDQIMTHITNEEIKQALFSIGDGKSLGPDGFSVCFFKRSWNTVGKEFTNVVKEFFSTEKLLKQINHTIIAMFPKSSHASTINDFRPIACCNVMYKVIAKIIAARIKPCLEDIFNPAQSAFVKHRIVDFLS